ncbi:hypothetical protein [Leptotrichia alba]|uniref:Glycosyltransferase RgtA/B/C/D-like domain-containing protein n=1 Tax=Leptotrichia alba TaxID=3239304 RepID=A0AB39V1Y3_9FUSO
MFLLIFLSLVFLYSKISRRKAEIIAPTIFFFIMTVLYFSGLMFSSFIYGNVFIILLSIGALIYFIYDVFKEKKNWKEIWEKFKSFIILYGIMAILLIGFISIVWDDFSHWLLTVKNMVLFNELSNNSKSTIIFKTYPPATAIIQYFYNFVGGIGFRSFNLEYNSQLITNYFVMILLLSMINMTPLSKKSKIILYPVLFLILAIFNQEIYVSLFVDVILSIMGAYLIILYEYMKKQKINKKFEFIDMVLATLFLSLVKSTGTAIIVFCLIYIIIDLILTKKYKFNLKIIITILISLLIAKKSWGYYLSKTKVDIMWETGKITLGNVLKIFDGKGQQYQYETINNFFKAILKQRIGIFSYTVFFIIMIGLLIYLYIRKNDNERLKLLIYNILIIIIYPISLLLMYIFIFSPTEAINLASFSRYLSTIVIFLILLNGLILIKDKMILRHEKITIKVITICIIILVFTNRTMKMFTIKKLKQIKKAKRYRNEIRKIPKEISINPNNKVYFISDMSKDGGYYHWIFKYEATPLKTQPFYYNDDENLFETLKNYDYLYLKDFDENFSKKYSTMFKNGLESNNFYRIEKENNEIKLIKVESRGK